MPTQPQTGTLCWGIINITHKLPEMKSEQAVLPNPCLEEEEEYGCLTRSVFNIPFLLKRPS
jgi:hypothetical protein